MDLNLSGRRALVCGSTQGIGLACARELAAQGARLCLLARRADELARLASELPGMDHEWLCADFRDTTALQETLARWIREGGSADILVNNTGGPSPGPLEQSGTEAFEEAFRMHLLASQVLVQALLPGMKARAWGRIVNVISTSVKQPLKGLGVSNTVRAAMAGWAKTLSNEVALFGITVNNVLPGATQTARLDGLIQRTAERLDKSTEEVSRDMQAQIPAGRFARPEETAAAVLFFASPAASYITGTSLAVDGGRCSSLN